MPTFRNILCSTGAIIHGNLPFVAVQQLPKMVSGTALLARSAEPPLLTLGISTGFLVAGGLDGSIMFSVLTFLAWLPCTCGSEERAGSCLLPGAFSPCALLVPKDHGCFGLAVFVC